MLSYLHKIEQVPGLYLYPEFVSESLALELWTQLDRDVWETKLSRRTQQYEYDYDYKRGTSSPIERKMSGHLSLITDHINKYVLVDKKPMDRVIVNEYTQKQGITAHIDRPEPFGDIIMSLSLGSEAVMDFSCSTAKYSLWLPRNSLIILSGSARYEWTHAIKSSIKQEGYTYTGVYRQENRSVDWRRISVTWRSGK